MKIVDFDAVIKEEEESGIDRSSSIKQVPEDTYECKIETAEEAISKNGDPQLRVYLAIDDNDSDKSKYNGVKVPLFMTFSEKGTRMAVITAKKFFGDDLPKTGNVTDLFQAVNYNARFNVRTTNGEDGRPFFLNLNDFDEIDSAEEAF